MTVLADKIPALAAAAPPVAPRRPAAVTRHGETVADDYAWLRDPDWQAVMKDPSVLRPDIRAYLEAENAHTEAAMAPLADLRATLFAEMKGRIKEDDSTVPAPDGAFEYYRRHDAGGQHPVFCRRARGAADGAADGGEEILYHGDREGAGHAFFRIGACRHSPDHATLAHTVDTKGSEYFTLGFRDIATGEDAAERIEGVKPGVVWANDGRTAFYVVLDDNHRPVEVRRHVLGTDPAADALVYAEPDRGFYIDLDKTESGRFVLIETHDHETDEVRLVDADAPASAPVLVAARAAGVRYSVAHHGDRLLILTNADGAEDFKIAEAPLAAVLDRPAGAAADRAAWRDLVPHRPGRLIRALLVFAGHLARLEREGGLPRVAVADLATGAEHEIAFDEDAYDLGLVPGYEFDTATLRLRYSSMITPERVYDYRMDSRDRQLRKEQEVPSGHDPAAYVTRRLFATAPDGARVPVSVAHRRDVPLDGGAPLLLYGYGSYGIAIPAAFSANRFSLIDRGVVYAIAHIRGGMDQGYRWYADGKLMAKKNSFTDFIAAAEQLAAEGYTRAGRIAAHGGSAGGMLVGAVANMRPDLFGAIVAEVPFVDVVNTICDPTLPLTPPEWPEWGNPIEDAAAYAYMRSYSPYDNVAARPYPAILATGGLTDPRVTYWEPAKWVARLRALKTDANPLLLRINMAAGHAGAAGRFDRLDEVALAYAFVLAALAPGAGRDGR